MTTILDAAGQKDHVKTGTGEGIAEDPTAGADRSFERSRREIRLILLLAAGESAGLVPINVMTLHGFAYLANTLAPVWDMPILDGSLLKRKGGPFYPALQRDLDRLVGKGVVEITSVGHVQEDGERWRLDGAFRLRSHLALPILAELDRFLDEVGFKRFALELAFALSSLSDEELTDVFTRDANYSDPMVGTNNVIDFAQWRQNNYSAGAANYFDAIVGEGTTTPSERTHLYVRHLRRRLVIGE